MKRKLFIILLFILLLKIKVNATTQGTLMLSYEDGIYYTMISDNFYMSYKFPFYTIGNDIVYCIQPGANITTYSYVGEDGFINSPYSDELNLKLELIAHYGYEYPDHNTIKYRMATQELIWELTGKIVEFWTMQYGNGNRIDVELEKEEIMRLVNEHYIKPSFDNITLEFNLGDRIVLTDTNNVLDYYNITNDYGNNIQKDNNNLEIEFTKPGSYTIELSKDNYDNEMTVVFIGNGLESQRLGKFRVSSILKSYINVNVIGARIKLVKKDSESNEVIKRRIKFKIKNIDTDEYICENSKCIFETNDRGYFITDNYYVGNYQITELEEQDYGNYVLNTDDLIISIDNTSNFEYDNDIIYNVEFTNKRVKGILHIDKIGEELDINNNTFNYNNIPLKDVKYNIFANDNIIVNDKIIYTKDDLVMELITDDNGQAISDYLEIGSYYLKEIESSNDNMIDNNIYYFDIEYDNYLTDTVDKYIKLYNYLPKGKLEFYKYDIDNNNPIEDTLIEIYYLNNNEHSLIYSDYTEIGRAHV